MVLILSYTHLMKAMIIREMFFVGVKRNKDV